MSVTSVDHGGEFRVGDVLIQSWRIFAGNLLFFLGVPVLIYVAVVFAVAIVFGLMFALAGGAAQSAGTAAAVVFLAIMLAVALNMVGQAVLLVGAFQRLRGERIRGGAALRRALARFFPLLGLLLLFGLALAFVGFVCFAFVSSLMTALGFLALLVVPVVCIPAVVLLVMWAVIVPACVVEGRGPIESMVRSADLTNGHRWKIFAVFLVLVIAYVVVGELTEAILAPIGPTLAGLAGLAWIAAWTAYWNCAVIMMYRDLRVAKEGVDTGEIAAVFD